MAKKKKVTELETVDSSAPVIIDAMSIASQFQQEWIPVEVRLPDTTRINFIAAKDSSDRIIFLNHKELIWYHYGIGVWFADIKMFNDKYPDLTIIAWQPVIEPQPYNPKQS